jgi:hypothetical protein
MTVYGQFRPPGAPSAPHPAPPPPPPPPGPADRRRPGRWHWLLWIPLVLPILTPLYNRTEPRLLGIPFFYWYQLALVFVDIAVITVVYQATKDR